MRDILPHSLRNPPRRPPNERRRGAPLAVTLRTLWQVNNYDRIRPCFLEHRRTFSATPRKLSGYSFAASQLRRGGFRVHLNAAPLKQRRPADLLGAGSASAFI